LVAAFLDWLLIGIAAAAIGNLLGVEAPSPPSADGGVNVQPAPGPFILVELAYFTYFHATSAGQSIGNRILGIRVLDADTGRSLPYARAFVWALMSHLSALPCFLGFFWMLWEPRKRTWHDIVADTLGDGPRCQASVTPSTPAMLSWRSTISRCTRRRTSRTWSRSSFADSQARGNSRS
jgi:uncharacterized RDD family membrane protein YckC